MPTYLFQARNEQDQLVEGTLDAENLAVAAEQLRRQGYAPTRLELYTESLPSQSALPTPSSPLSPTTQFAISEEISDAEPAPLQPWERGGPVPAPSPSPVQPTLSLGDPTLSLSSFTTPSPFGAREQPIPQHLSPLPSLAASAKPSLYRRFLETCIYPVWSGVLLAHMAEFYRQFATLINAGMPLYQALNTLAHNTHNRQLKQVLQHACAHVERGGRLSEVFAQYPWIFPPLHIAMIHAAEQGGLLEDSFRQLSDYVEHEIALRRILRAETFYPKLVLLFALMVLGRGFFATHTPAISQLVLGGMGKANYTLWNYLNDTLFFGLEIAIPFALLVAVFRLFLFNIPGIRETYDTIKTNIPGLGKLVRTFATAKFLRTYAALYRAGFPMSETVRIAGEASGNVLLRNAALQAVTHAYYGGAVSEALYRAGFLQPAALDMLRTGEASGNIDEILQKTADYYEQEGQVKARQAAMIFSVVVFLLVAILVAMAIISFYSGYAAGISAAGG